MTEDQIDERTLSVCSGMIAAGLDPRFVQRLWRDRQMAVEALRELMENLEPISCERVLAVLEEVSR